MDETVADAILRIADAVERIVELVEEQAESGEPLHIHDGMDDMDYDIPATL